MFWLHGCLHVGQVFWLLVTDLKRHAEWNRCPHGVDETSQFGVKLSRHIAQVISIFFPFFFQSNNIASHNWITLYNVILRIARNLLENREDIKYLTQPFYCTNLDWFSKEWRKKKKIWRKKFKIAFHRLVLGLVGLFDVKDIDEAQPIWSGDCLT